MYRTIFSRMLAPRHDHYEGGISMTELNGGHPEGNDRGGTVNLDEPGPAGISSRADTRMFLYLLAFGHIRSIKSCFI